MFAPDSVTSEQTMGISRENQEQIFGHHLGILGRSSCTLRIPSHIFPGTSVRAATLHPVLTQSFLFLFAHDFMCLATVSTDFPSWKGILTLELASMMRLVWL